MSEAPDRAGDQGKEPAQTAETQQVMRVPRSGGDLAVVTPEALEQYFAAERRRNFRAICWISSAFLLVILAVCSLFLSLGSLIMRNSRQAMSYADQTAQKADLALRGYDRKIEETASTIQTVDKKASTLTQSVAEDRQKYSRDRDTLRQDLVKFSEWYGVKQTRVNNAVASIGTIEQRLAELERNDAARKGRLEDLERWFREARSSSREAAPIVIPAGVSALPAAAAPTSAVVEVVAKNEPPAPVVPQAVQAPAATQAIAATTTQTITYEDGGKYVGEVSNGLKHGQGEQTFPNGDKYVGSFQNDMRQGQGVYHYNSGARYEGEFVGGKRDGRGKYFYPNGDVYDGYFSGGLMNGSGIYIYANGTQIDGIWRDDTFVGD